jgi:signal transduction histidine kinase
MLNQFFNWRTSLAIIAIAIVTGTVFYSNYLSEKLAADEREKVAVWVQSLKTRAAVTDQAALDLTNAITSHNSTIPIIETDEHDNPSGQLLNIDTALLKIDSNFLRKKVQEFKSQNDAIIVEVNKDPLIINKYYFGDSKLLREVKYYPIVQLLIVALFILITLITITTRHKSTQNQVWAGMAKETAHQLGTPLSSLQGWVELLKEMPGSEKVAKEMIKDVDRLKLVSDRFSKIGSHPQLESVNLIEQIENMVAYIKRRAPEKISFSVDNAGLEKLNVMANGPLFDWVIENLLKNALDATEASGNILIKIKEESNSVIIEVTDSGKGISKQNLGNIFKPGFTTKKRGWGLGLSLSKRIIEQYHQGQLFVKNSELGKGTTFKIILKK